MPLASASVTSSAAPEARQGALIARLSLFPIANLLLAGIAILLGPPGRPHELFLEGELMTWLPAVQLMAAGLIAWMIWEFSARATGRASTAWLLLAIGLLFLAADEYLEIHEMLGRWLQTRLGFHPPRPFDRFDNIVISLYAIPAAAGGLLFWREYLRHRPSAALFVAGGGLLALSLVVDSVLVGLVFEKEWGPAYRWSYVIEETLKSLGTAVMLWAMLVRLAHQTGSPALACDRYSNSRALTTTREPGMGALLVGLSLALFASLPLLKTLGADIEALTSSRGVVPCFASAERFLAAVLLLFLMSLSTSSGWRSPGCVALLLVTSGLLILSSLQSCLPTSPEIVRLWRLPARQVDLVELLFWSIVWAAVVFGLRHVIRALEPSARRLIQLGALIAILALTAGIARSLRPPDTPTAWLHLAGLVFSVGASTCLAIVVYLQTRAALLSFGRREARDVRNDLPQAL